MATDLTRLERRPRLAAAMLAMAAVGLLLAACTVEVARSEDAAPDFDMVLFGTADHEKGEEVTLSQFAGQPVVLNFWYPSCPPCRLEMPDLEQSYQDHKADGVQFLGIQLLGLDSVEDGQVFVEEFGVNYAIGPDSDGRIVRDYGVISFPTTIILTEDQRIGRKWAGVLTGEKLEELIQDVVVE